MKIKTFAIIIAFFLSGIFSYAVVSNNSVYSTDTYQNIQLSDGDYNNGGGDGVRPRSLTFAVIEAVQIGQSAVEVSFNEAFKNVTVSIEDNAGIVYYENTITASQGYVLSIDISSLEAGTYTIKINSEEEELYKYGDFDID